jgi:hypothetical protein
VHSVGYNSLTVARTSQYNAPVVFASGYSFSDGTYPDGVVYWLLRISAQVLGLVAPLRQELFNLFFVGKSGVV